MLHRRAQVLLGPVILMLFSPKPSLAFDLLWEAQGSYVHQIAHFIFAVVMVFLVYEIKRSEIRGMAGFRSLVWSCVLLAWWNFDAIIGHALDWNLTSPVILGQGLGRRLLMEDWQSWVYYLTKCTHFLLLLPAFYFFYRSLKRFNREPETKSL